MITKEEITYYISNLNLLVGKVLLYESMHESMLKSKTIVLKIDYEYIYYKNNLQSLSTNKISIIGFFNWIQNFNNYLTVIESKKTVII